MDYSSNLLVPLHILLHDTGCSLIFNLLNFSHMTPYRVHSTGSLLRQESDLKVVFIFQTSEGSAPHVCKVVQSYTQLTASILGFLVCPFLRSEHAYNAESHCSSTGLIREGTSFHFDLGQPCVPVFLFLQCIQGNT